MTHPVPQFYRVTERTANLQRIGAMHGLDSDLRYFERFHARLTQPRL